MLPSTPGHDRIGVMLTYGTDWDELRELVTESYRILVPKKLTDAVGRGSPDASPGSPRQD